MNRKQALDSLYDLLASSERQLGGMRELADSTVRAGVPAPAAATTAAPSSAATWAPR